MKPYEFFELCSEHCIEPDIALENVNLARAIALGDDEKVKQILKEEF